MSNSKKLTSAQLRDMTREFFTRRVSQPAEQSHDGLLNESMAELPPPGAGRKQPVSTDATILADDYLQAAVFDGLEEMGVTAEQADEIIRQLYNRPDMLKVAITNGLYDYKRKLEMMGGTPKPRQM